MHGLVLVKTVSALGLAQGQWTMQEIKQRLRCQKMHLGVEDRVIRSELSIDSASRTVVSAAAAYFQFLEHSCGKNR